MDIATLILYFYLLLPVLAPQQEWLCAMLEWQPYARAGTVTVQDDVRGYAAALQAEREWSVSPEDFDFSDEDDIPLPGGLETPQYGPQSEAAAEALVNGEGLPAAAEVQFKNSMNRLVLFDYGEEQLAVSRSSGHGKRLVSVNSGYVTSTRYDASWRPLEKLVLKNASSLADITPFSRTRYSYRSPQPQEESLESSENLQNSVPPAYESPELVTEEFFSEKRVVETLYSPRGLPLTVNEYELTPRLTESGEESGEETRTLRKSTMRSYDAQDRLVLEEETAYFEKTDPLRKDRRLPAQASRRNEYEYTELSSVPDLRFYENGQLRLYDEHLSQDSYLETLYFDNDYRVRVKYEHGRKVQEVIYLGDAELSRREFE